MIIFLLCICFLLASFEVEVNDTVVFSKLETHGFPSAEQVSAIYLFYLAQLLLIYFPNHSTPLNVFEPQT